MRKSLIIIVSLILGCVEPYDFNVLTTDTVLVVDALLTNEPGPHRVRLSYSYPIDDFYLAPELGARVTISDDHGNVEVLEETFSGEYVTSEQFRGVPGNSYVLEVETQNGLLYRSTPQELLESPPIQKVFGEYRDIPSQENEEILQGIQFFVDTDAREFEAQRFRYAWESTYEVRSPFPSLFEWSEAENDLVWRDQQVGICFRSDSSNTLILASSTGQVDNRIDQYPLNFVDQRVYDLKFKYALNVKQYALSPSTYTYYKRLKENNESTGSLFDKQLGPIAGNISAVGNPDIVVLGNFEVSGISQKRTFFKPIDFYEQGFRPQRHSFCNYELEADSLALGEEFMEFYVNHPNSATNNVYIVLSPPDNLAIVLSEWCTDCRKQGTLERPDFWE